MDAADGGCSLQRPDVVVDAGQTGRHGVDGDVASGGLPPPVDGVTAALNDVELLSSDTRSARDLGFGAKLCVHPRQVDVVHAAFLPSEHEIAWANRVLAADTSGGVDVVDGAMVDAPVLARAHAILSRARS